MFCSIFLRACVFLYSPATCRQKHAKTTRKPEAWLQSTIPELEFGSVVTKVHFFRESLLSLDEASHICTFLSSCAQLVDSQILVTAALESYLHPSLHPWSSNFTSIPKETSWEPIESSIHWFLKASLFGLFRSKNSGPDCYVESTGSFGTVFFFLWWCRSSYNL